MCSELLTASVNNNNSKAKQLRNVHGTWHRCKQRMSRVASPATGASHERGVPADDKWFDKVFIAARHEHGHNRMLTGKDGSS
jgi:hypothetical protein